MTVKAIIDHIDKIKPNTFDTEAKMFWLNEVEGKISAELFLKSENEIKKLTGEDDELSALQCYSSVYIYYVIAMMDFLCGEFEKYNASSAAYNKAMSDYAKYVIRGGVK